MISLSVFATLSIYCPVISFATDQRNRPCTFTMEKVCNFEDKFDYGCIELASSGNNSVTESTCARLCSGRDLCEGFSLDTTARCYLHFYCTGQSHLNSTCQRPQTDLRYFSRKTTPDSCLNGGVWNTDSQSCNCVGGLVGHRCERYAESCQDLALSGKYNGIYLHSFMIQLAEAAVPIPVICSMNNGFIRTHIITYGIESLSPGFSFNHTWNEYVRGFFDSSEYNFNAGWIGLEAIHQLTTLAKMQTLTMRVVGVNNEILIRFTFEGTVVGNASTNYQLSYDRVTVGAGQGIRKSRLTPCLAPGSGVPFSTPDVDNDADEDVHCAKEAAAGWWFSHCNPRPSCNPLGVPYETGLEDVTADRIHFENVDMRMMAGDLTFIRIYLE